MSFLDANTEVIAEATVTSANTGQTMAMSVAAAQMPTAQVAPPAADQVSLLALSALQEHTQYFQTKVRDLLDQHGRIVENLVYAMNSYAQSEAANVADMG